LQDAVSLSALNEFLGEAYAVGDPGQLADLPVEAQDRIDAWIDLAADLLYDPLISISCLINPQAVYIGGRLPEVLIDKLAKAVTQKLSVRRSILTMAPVYRAALAADAPAMGAAILPIINRFLPSRSALRNTDQA
jgi:predicted NBD/HSP70 family sugar kinase